MHISRGAGRARLIAAGFELDGLTFPRSGQAKSTEDKLSDTSKLFCDHSARSDAIAASLMPEASESADVWTAKDAMAMLALICTLVLPLLPVKFASPE